MVKSSIFLRVPELNDFSPVVIGQFVCAGTSAGKHVSVQGVMLILALYPDSAFKH